MRDEKYHGRRFGTICDILLSDREVEIPSQVRSSIGRLDAVPEEWDLRLGFLGGPSRH